MPPTSVNLPRLIADTARVLNPKVGDLSVAVHPMAQIEESIARYLSQLDSADRQGDVVPEAKITRLNEKIATLRQEIQRLNALNAQMMQAEDKQISLTDPDARSMATSGRGSGMVGYAMKPMENWIDDFSPTCEANADRRPSQPQRRPSSKRRRQGKWNLRQSGRSR